MNINDCKKTKLSFWKRIFTRFLRKKKPEFKTDGTAVSRFVSVETTRLWKMVNAKNNGETVTENLKEEIRTSFLKLIGTLTIEQQEDIHVWSRYVMLAIYSLEPPKDTLINYVTAENYIFCSKELAALLKHFNRQEIDLKALSMEQFTENVYLHILNGINSSDSPSILALGHLAKRRNDYQTAKQWYSRLLESDNYFNGLTALLSCYAEETKCLLNEQKTFKGPMAVWRKKLDSLNDCQCRLYTKWCGILENKINAGNASESEKQEYVQLIAGFARFEKNRNNYDKAYGLLEKIPDFFPEIHRIYAEKAMLFQYKPFRNHYYNLEKAVESFYTADRLILECENSLNNNAKARKSILIPLANACFQLGRYDEALKACDTVLKLDSKEYNAIKLKQQIALMVP